MRLVCSQRNHIRQVMRRASALLTYVLLELPEDMRSRSNAYAMLYVADLQQFKESGQTMTGVDWIKRRNGPRPYVEGRLVKVLS